MLPKVGNILKNSSNKSFSASNFWHKSLLGLERHGLNIKLYLPIETEKYIHFFQPSHLSRPLAPLGAIDIHPRGLFCPKFDAGKLLFKAFFGIMRIFGSVRPKSECSFPFLYI